MQPVLVWGCWFAAYLLQSLLSEGRDFFLQAQFIKSTLRGS